MYVLTRIKLSRLISQMQYIEMFPVFFDKCNDSFDLVSITGNFCIAIWNYLKKSATDDMGRIKYYAQSLILIFF
jgi:hypothetical protein